MTSTFIVKLLPRLDVIGHRSHPLLVSSKISNGYNYILERNLQVARLLGASIELLGASLEILGASLELDPNTVMVMVMVVADADGDTGDGDGDDADGDDDCDGFIDGE